MRKAFYSGLLAGTVAVSISAILRFTLGIGTLAEALADALTRHLPLSLFSLAVNTLGNRAKISLTIVIALLMVLLAGALSILARRAFLRMGFGTGKKKWLAGLAFSLLIWLLALLIVLPASGRGVFGLALPTFPAAVVLLWLAALLVYSLLMIALWPRPTSLPAPQPVGGISRGSFLRTAGVAGAGVLAAGALGLTIWKALWGAAGGAVSNGRMPRNITPNEEFYYVSKDFVDPQVDLASWKLEIGGLIEPKLIFSFADIAALPASTFEWTLECIGNDVGGTLIGNALWKGVRLGDLLASARVGSEVTQVVFYGVDDYADSVSLGQALSDTFLVYEMNGANLPAKHGFPIRVLIADLYGMKNIKWLSKIEFIDHEFEGFWEGAGWSDTAVVKTMSRIDTPGRVTHIKLGDSLLLAGVAYAGSRGISKIEISSDGGQTWQGVNGSENSPVSWALWSHSWTADAVGEYSIKVRATDGLGELQSDQRTYALPDGATGLDSALVIVDPGF